MHLFVSYLTAASLFAHAVLGCCGHHGHELARAHHQAALVDACDHGHDHHQSSEHSPCNCKFECRLVCNFLPTQKTHLDFSSVVAPFGVVASLQADLDDYFANTAIGDLVGEPNVFEPPSRLHLLHQ